MRILYVEDNTAFATIACREFLAGQEVTIAASLEEARQILQEGEFDVVLLDYDLPDGKGVELLDTLALTGLRNRVIAVSALEANNRLLLKAGAIAAVRKARFGELSAALAEIGAGQ